MSKKDGLKLARGDELKLLKGENIIRKIKPHYMAFYDMYLIWAWMVLLSSLFFIAGDQLAQIFGNPMAFFTGFFDQATSPSDNPLIGKLTFFHSSMGGVNALISPVHNFMISYTPAGLWISVILISSFAVSVFKIEFKWAAAMLAVAVASLGIALAAGLGSNAAFTVGILLSIAAAGTVEIYRRGHTFFVTDFRIVTQVEFLGIKRNELSYDRINNIVFTQDVFGKVFGFGTINPITASGLGMGSDFAMVSVGAASSKDGSTMSAGITGGRAVQVPRPKSMYALFGVTHPKKVQEIISGYMREYVEAPYLKRMEEKMGESLEKR